GELTFRTLSRNPVITSLFDTPESWEVRHVALAERAGLLLVAPATANFLAKMAHGIADDALSTFAAACFDNVLLAPAMNERMWRNPATAANVDALAARGVGFCGPATGELACGSGGIGRMEEPQTIFEAALKRL
ncbi:MAG: flavoprotein, partial [Victivallaceae bacterium]|nr:flavoprotein [Victivallaceae bacterium]